MGFRSIILSSRKAESWLKTNKPKAIILFGGSASVYEENAPAPPKEILKLKLPVLGICYGMHWLVQELSGIITPHQEHKEYGIAKIKLSANDRLFLQTKPSQVVWASHGDSVTQTSSNFKVIATSNNKQTVAAISNSPYALLC
ncbi:gamma-glutamyl-gamma-aminobutyrate hydrolase family protein [Patescibacteria group bacterium]|nr:gamma-glutamyl-gamma-aminobutyrate hydrolase family protein [Patescibacteria group bacterium]MBU1730483.1 gamma-glutamyl-gamma-aminobutyrate hydrolase family protein [Patescibacteria group bacterium]MBU1956630.1 gamma-glutamyl-gamma-aminobutyrate hydrolase family protein [Patescibacteria group bacterium]